MTPAQAGAELLAIAASIREKDPLDAAHRLMERIAIRDDREELTGSLVLHGCFSLLAHARLDARPEDVVIALRALNPES